MSSQIRISLFSFHKNPEHRIINISELENELDWAKHHQYGIVLTEVDNAEPTEYNGPGIDDRRNKPLGETSGYCRGCGKALPLVWGESYCSDCANHPHPGGYGL